MAAMVKALDEGRQRFTFDLSVWRDLVKYDDSDVHRLVIRSVAGIKAVDFIAIGRDSPAIAFVEVKDFRGAARENRARLRSDLAKEVAAKVAGTIAGLAGASRGLRSGFAWSTAASHLVNPRRRLLVVVHVESDDWPSVADARVQLGVLENQLENALAWLAECRVIACCEAIARLPACEVVTF
jgi:hypothetical protein